MRTSTQRLPGLVPSNHQFLLPLNHKRPGGEKIVVFAREVVSVEHEHKTDLPWLVFFQGGSGSIAASGQQNRLAEAGAKKWSSTQMKFSVRFVRSGPRCAPSHAAHGTKATCGFVTSAIRMFCPERRSEDRDENDPVHTNTMVTLPHRKLRGPLESGVRHVQPVRSRGFSPRLLLPASPPDDTRTAKS